jgi:serine-type D-Ala-D-Ala carboxypeptidase (penicillin-binding protein 5/6)
VSLLHCPALTEITAGKSLLNWGFAVDGKVRPVGTLVGPKQPPAATPPAATPAPSRPAVTAGRAEAAARAQSVGSGPSVLATAGFSGLALLVAGIGFAHNRRQRSAAQRRS